MKWETKCCTVYLGLLLFLAFLLLGFSAAQAQEEPSQAPTTPTNWDSFDQLLTQLESEILNSNGQTEKQGELLVEALNQLKTASLNLEKSEILTQEQSASLKQYESIQKSLEKQLVSQRLELWLWRGGTALAVVGIIFALAK